MAIAIIIAAVALAFTAWFVTRDGRFLITRHQGFTCPACDGLGRDGDGPCRECKGRRMIWDRP